MAPSEAIQSTPHKGGGSLDRPNGRSQTAEVPERRQLVLDMSAQPNDSTCGPTCLHAVYRYYDDEIPLETVIREVTPLDSGGTLAVLLGIHALRRGYRATVYAYNLRIFDPMWFQGGTIDLRERLQKQMTAKLDATLQFVSERYLEYLELGGTVRFEQLTPELIRRYLKRGLPILTGLSATYLYGCSREVGKETLRYDDVCGEPTGHFVVLSGYDTGHREVLVADPLQNSPLAGAHYYWIAMQRVLGAIMLGVLTNDGNLLILEPNADHKERS
jgi:hypothetical protein